MHITTNQPDPRVLRSIGAPLPLSSEPPLYPVSVLNPAGRASLAASPRNGTVSAWYTARPPKLALSVRT
ncbi:hypothetical protein CCHR01_10378 [Colletotrichum chrysophilum]|uniref:Uncharacterized protein n=1 Tax=Colletotrichum chrysophilum TaxID=1836956 RepID=A0AAD9AF19_9PEZI|nr:hypothetical protein CCHR01_10378 [Colletotrichum chrysophilum]